MTSKIVILSLGAVLLHLTACDPITVESDLRTPDSGTKSEDAATPAPALSTCELAGFACASLSQLREQLGIETCPAGLYVEPFDCETRDTTNDAWLCCGTKPVLPEISKCESTGGICWSRSENAGECPTGSVPSTNTEITCDLSDTRRPELRCCERDPNLEPTDQCTATGFYCTLPSAETAGHCPPAYKDVDLACSPDPGMNARICCGT